MPFIHASFRLRRCASHRLLFAALLALLLAGAASPARAENPDPVTNAIDPTAAHAIGLVWDFPPYLLVNLPPEPGDILMTQGPFPHIAPVLQKRGFITGHAGLYNGRKDADGDGVEEYACAEAARYGVWYGYYYPLHRFEKGHGRLDEWLEKDGELAKFMKSVFGENLSKSALVAKYDDVLDGTFMGARTVDALSESPREYEYRRKILEFSHTYVLKNSNYSYDAFKQPLLSLFHALNARGTGGYGAGHNEDFTCVGLSEAAYQYAGIDLTPRFIEETHAGLTPFKQFSYTKPVSRLKVAPGEKTSFEVWHVISGHRTYAPGVAADPVPPGCSFDGRTFTVDGGLLAPGTHEVAFRSLAYPDQHQTVRILAGAAPLPAFDLKDLESGGFRAVDAPDPALAARVEAIAARGGREKERDKALLAELTSATGVNDIAFIARRIGNGAARDLACLYGLKHATRIEDLYKLAMFADSTSAGSKILYAPLGYTVAGIDRALASAVRSTAWFSWSFNRECAALAKACVSTDYRFERTVDLALPLSFDDVARLDAIKIGIFLDRMAKNPAELNLQENAYLVSLIQKRVYFGLADGDPAASAIRSLVKRLSDEARAKIKVDATTNLANVVESDRLAARFLQSLAESLDVERAWLDAALSAEKRYLAFSAATAGAAPGIGPAHGALLAGTLSGRLRAPFERIFVRGALSPQLRADVAAGNPGAEIVDLAGGSDLAGSVAPVPASAQVNLPETADAFVPGPLAPATGALSREAAEARERYERLYRKYVQALGYGTPDASALASLRGELARALEDYRAALDAPAGTGNTE